MYKNLNYFFSAYFHQDWKEIEGKTKEEIINNFVSNELHSLVMGVLSELSIVLEREKYIPADFVYDMGCFMVPDIDAYGSIRAWLYEIYNYMNNLADHN